MCMSKESSTWLRRASSISRAANDRRATRPVVQFTYRSVHNQTSVDNKVLSRYTPGPGVSEEEYGVSHFMWGRDLP